MIDSLARVCASYAWAEAWEIRSDVRGNHVWLAVGLVRVLIRWTRRVWCEYTYISKSETCRGDRFANRLLPAGSRHFFTLTFYLFFCCFILLLLFSSFDAPDQQATCAAPEFRESRKRFAVSRQYFKRKKRPLPIVIVVATVTP